MARMTRAEGAQVTVTEGEPTLDDRDFDEGEAAAESAPAPGLQRKLGASFEGLGLKVRRSAAGRLTLGVEIELGLNEKVQNAGEVTVLGEEAAEEIEEAAPKPAPALRLSEKGAMFIARFEGVRLKLYDDPAGHCTIGVGHLVHRGRCNGREPAAFKRGLTRAQAYALLQEDARKAESAVRKLRVPLNQQQFDALVSFTFNLGAGWTRQSKLREALLARRYKDVPREMSRWVHAGKRQLPGLIKRRRAEGRLFRHGKYE